MAAPQPCSPSPCCLTFRHRPSCLSFGHTRGRFSLPQDLARLWLGFAANLAWCPPGAGRGGYWSAHILAELLHPPLVLGVQLVVLVHAVVHLPPVVDLPRPRAGTRRRDQGSRPKQIRHHRLSSEQEASPPAPTYPRACPPGLPPLAALALRCSRTVPPAPSSSPIGIESPCPKLLQAGVSLLSTAERRGLELGRPLGEVLVLLRDPHRKRQHLRGVVVLDLLLRGCGEGCGGRKQGALRLAARATNPTAAPLHSRTRLPARVVSPSTQPASAHKGTRLEVTLLVAHRVCHCCHQVADDFQVHVQRPGAARLVRHLLCTSLASPPMHLLPPSIPSPSSPDFPSTSAENPRVGICHSIRLCSCPHATSWTGVEPQPQSSACRAHGRTSALMSSATDLGRAVARLGFGLGDGPPGPGRAREAGAPAPAPDPPTEGAGSAPPPLRARQAPRYQPPRPAPRASQRASTVRIATECLARAHPTRTWPR